jgi:RND family efflux transporter MFP subunit
MTEQAQQTTDNAGPRKHRLLIGAAIAAVVVAGAATAYDGSREVRWSDEGHAGPTAAVVRPAPMTAAPATVAAPVDISTVDVRGVVHSRAEATLSSRITARITSMPYRTGDRFGAGAVMARFDCSPMRAQLTAANAAATAHRTTYQTNVELDQYKAIAKNDVAVSRANLGKASAEASAIAAQLGDCDIRAPFSGIVVEQIAHGSEVASPGQPLLKIQNSRDLEVQLIVPSNWLTWLKPGVAFSFIIDETGKTHHGRIANLGAAVDPVSKTVRVTGTLDQAGGLVMPGMSGSARFARQAGHDVPA